jgi:hypothetical protein
MLGSGQTPQWNAIADDFMNARFWLTLVILMISGAFGGVAYELLLRKGTIELPHRVHPNASGRNYHHAPHECLIALGIIGRALVGAAAAAAVLMVLAPSTAHAAVALGVTSGAAAPAIIRLMRKQLLFAANLLSRMSQHASAQEQPASREQPAPRRAATSPA